jgi:hypothetical protein
MHLDQSRHHHVGAASMTRPVGRSAR